MNAIKNIWMRLLRFLDEERERRRILSEAPSREHVREMIAAIEKGRAELAEAAVRNGVRTL